MLLFIGKNKTQTESQLRREFNKLEVIENPDDLPKIQNQKFELVLVEGMDFKHRLSGQDIVDFVSNYMRTDKIFWFSRMAHQKFGSSYKKAEVIGSLDAVMVYMYIFLFKKLNDSLGLYQEK